MANEKRKKATLEALVARASSKQATVYKEYECELLGLTLEVKKLPVTRIYEIMDMYEGDSLIDSLEQSKQLIYESVPLFQNDELRNVYKVAEPYDVVTEILEENLGEIEKLSKFIMQLYGLLVDDLKN